MQQVKPLLFIKHAISISIVGLNLGIILVCLKVDSSVSLLFTYSKHVGKRY